MGYEMKLFRLRFEGNGQDSLGLTESYFKDLEFKANSSDDARYIVSLGLEECNTQYFEHLEMLFNLDDITRHRLDSEFKNRPKPVLEMKEGTRWIEL